MTNETTHKGFGMTAKEYNRYRGQAMARNAAREENEKRMGQRVIGQGDIDMLRKMLDAPVDLFIKLM